MQKASPLSRRFEVMRPWAEDALRAACYTAISLVLGFHQVPPGWQPLDARGVALTCLVNLPMVFRRLATVSVCVAVCLLWAVFTTLDYWPGINSVTPLVAIYSVAASRSRGVALACAALLAAVWNYTWYWESGNERSWVIVLGQSLLYPLLLCWLGDIARTSEQRAQRLAQLTERLRREQQEGERRAVAEERVRIARELHDVVAHHMAVISVQAGLAGYVFSSDPPVARKALSTIAGTSTEALDEMRRLLSVLRIGPEGTDGDIGTVHGYHPTPGLDRLEEVVERVRAAGVKARLEVTGNRRPLPPGVELCAYRVVQEALTNVLKHAGGAASVVRVEYFPERLTVTVSDDGIGHRGHMDPANSAPSARHGLIGMRERARIYGGKLDVGPRESGGFVVRLDLPVHSATGSGPSGEGTSDSDQSAGRR